MSGATAVIESKLSKGLRKFLQKTIVDKEITDKLAVADAKLGGLIKNKLGINCVHDNAAINELMRGIRTQVRYVFGRSAALFLTSIRSRA